MEKRRPNYEEMTKRQKGLARRRIIRATLGAGGAAATALLLDACGPGALVLPKTPGPAGDGQAPLPPGRQPADTPVATEQAPQGPSFNDLVRLNMKLKPDVTTSHDPSAQSDTALETAIEFNPLPPDEVPVFRIPFDNTTVSEVWDQDNPNRTGKTIIIEFNHANEDYSLMVTNIQPDRFNPKLTPGAIVTKATEIGLMGRESDQRILVKDQPDRRVAIVKLWKGKGRTDENRIAVSDLFPDLPGTKPVVPQEPTQAQLPAAATEPSAPSQPQVAQQPTEAVGSNVETQNIPETSGAPDRAPIQVDAASTFYAVRNQKTKEFAFIIDVQGGQEPRSEAPISGTIVEVWDNNSTGGLKKLHDLYGDTLIIEAADGISCSLSGLDLSKQVIPIKVGTQVTRHQGLTGIEINTTRYQDIQTTDGKTIVAKGKPVVRQLCFKGPRTDANRIDLPSSVAERSGPIGDNGSQSNIISDIWNAIFGK